MTDGDGASVGDSRSIRVRNVAPVVRLAGVPDRDNGVVGTPLSLLASAQDAGTADVVAGLTFRWSIEKDGETFAAGTGSRMDFTPLEIGTYFVKVTVIDKDGATSTPDGALIRVHVDKTTTTLTSSSDQSVWGQPVTFTATVHPQVLNSAAPEGSVVFLDNGGVVGTAELRNLGGRSEATFVPASFEVGHHTITSIYQGNADFLSSNSDGLVLTVRKADPLVSWGEVRSIAYGTTLGSGQLNATAGVAGSFSYAPGPGIVLHVGSNQTLTAVFTPDDTAHYDTVTSTTCIAVTAIPVVVSAEDQVKVYGSPLPALKARYTGFVNGDTFGSAITGSPDLVTDATASSAVGTYPIRISLGSLSAHDYNFLFVNGTLTVNQASTSTALAVSAAKPLFGVDTVTLAAAVAVVSPGSGNPTGTIGFYDVTTGLDLGSAPVINGTAALSTNALAVGTHCIIATYSGDGNFLLSAGATSLRVLKPASLSGTVYKDFNNDGQVDFGEGPIAGVAVRLTGTDEFGHAIDRTLATDADGTYLFLNLRPGNYSLTETQPADYLQGIDSVGTAGGSLAAADQFFVQLAEGADGLNYNYGERPPISGTVQHGQTAGIGFWNNKNGQALIKAFNGGTGTQLADWLAATLPNIFGVHAGTNNLTGKSNAYVAALFQQDFLMKGVKLDAQVLATALSVYATSATLDSTGVAAQYGFLVSGDGVATAMFNVGSNGAAFGVADNTTMTIMDLLLATNSQAVNGVLYNGNTAKRTMANNVYSAVNQAGGIG